MRPSSFALAGLVLFFAAAAAMAGGREDDLVDRFARYCLAEIPDFEGTKPLLRADGFKLVSLGDDKYEFGNAAAGLSGNLVAGSGADRNAGCTLASSRTDRATVRRLLIERLTAMNGIRPPVWRYNGKDAGWRIPGKVGVMYIMVDRSANLATGASIAIEMRDR